MARSEFQKIAGRRVVARGRTVGLAVVLGLGSVGAALAVSGASAGAANAKPGVSTPGPAGASPTPQVPHVRPSIAGPGPSNVFVTNNAADTATGYPTSASGDAAPTYGVGGNSTSPFEAEAEAFDAAGDLWVANGNSTIVEYPKSSLAQSGNPAPAVVLTSDGSNSISSPSGLVFDASGDLWATNSGNGPGAGSVVEFTRSELAASASPTPAVTISSNGTNINGPYGLTFDSSGNLWVSNYNGNTVVEFAANQLGTSGATIPAVTLTMPGTVFPATCGPNGATFDASGNLWVPCYNENQVLQIAKSSLGSTGTPTPAVTLSSTSNSLSQPEYATFDSSGDLWVVNSSATSTVVEFKADNITSSGSPVPDVTLSPTGVGTPTVSLAGPYQLVFDSSGNAWVVNSSSLTISAFSPSQYAASGSPIPAIQITPAFGLDSPQLETFDSSGNLWIANSGSSSVVAFTPAQLAAGATRPAIALTLPAESFPEGVSFDGSGDLWVSDLNHGALYEFTPAQLSSSGFPTPKVTITSGSLLGPAGLAFAASGDLWVVNRADSSIVEFTPGQLATSGSPTPAATITSDGSNSLATPTGATFDTAGDLWVSNGRTGGPPVSSVVEYTSAQLAAGTGSPTPNVTLTADASGSLDIPMGLGFDTSGNLWVANEGNNSLVEFSPSQVAATGSPTPLSTVAGPATQLDSPIGVAIPPLNVRPATSGYWLAAADGGIFSFGNHPFFGSMGGKPLNKPVVGMAPTPVFGSTGGHGYWEVATDGGIFSFGDAQFHGSMGGKPLNKPVVGMAATPDGGGYWEVAADGGIFNFGDAHFYGSTGAMHLNAPVVGMASTAGRQRLLAGGGRRRHLQLRRRPLLRVDGRQAPQQAGGRNGRRRLTGRATGWWPPTAASSASATPSSTAPWVASRSTSRSSGLSPTNDGKGYWEVATDGGIFSFGNALFEGSMGGMPLNQPVVGMAS